MDRAIPRRSQVASRALRSTELNVEEAESENHRVQGTADMIKTRADRINRSVGVLDDSTQPFAFGNTHGDFVGQSPFIL